MIMDHNNTITPENWEGESNILKVIGVGGGGTNAVNYMYEQKIPHIDFVVCNTDSQHLKDSPVPVKLLLGEISTKGLGAGTDSMVGRKAAIESREEINNILGNNTKMVFITCGMGGGTGTGAAPVIAEAAKSRGILTIGVVTLPFRDEGTEALVRAVDGIEEMRKHVDSLLIIDNQKLYEVFPDLELVTSFPKVNETLATAVKSISEIITTRGYINVDFADVHKIMKDSGMALMGRGMAKGADRVELAVKQALSSPLLSEVDISTATRLLINITSSKDPGRSLKTQELEQIMAYVRASVGNVITSKRGVVFDDTIEDYISVTIIATGFAMNSLPTVNRDLLNRENIIVVDVSDKNFENSKHGIPHTTETTSLSTKPRVKGIPALIVTSRDQIAKMESEPAYIRRERMLAQQNQEADAAAED